LTGVNDYHEILETIEQYSTFPSMFLYIRIAVISIIRSGYGPGGTFSFSPEKGYSGEADKVLITDKAKNRSVSAALSTTLQQDKGNVQRHLSVENKFKSDGKVKIKKTTVSWKWIIAGIAFLSVLGWLPTGD
jgi:hypothetical protein